MKVITLGINESFHMKKSQQEMLDFLKENLPAEEEEEE